MTLAYDGHPRFVDRLALDVVVREHRYMNLTTPERRHACHQLSAQGLDSERIADIMHINARTVLRMLEKPPPPMLDINEDGNYVTEDGRVLHSAIACPECGEPVYSELGLCRYHRDKRTRRLHRERVSVDA